MYIKSEEKLKITPLVTSVYKKNYTNDCSLFCVLHPDPKLDVMDVVSSVVARLRSSSSIGPIAGHTKDGLNGGTCGTGMFPSRI